MEQLTEADLMPCPEGMRRIFWPADWMPPLFEVAADGTVVRFIGPLTKDDLR